MFEKDILMREIQQAARAIAQMLAKVLMFRQVGQVDEALQVIDEAGELLLDIDFGHGEVHTYEDVVDQLTAEKASDRELMSVLSEMLRHHGELHAMREDWPAAHHSLQLALRLELRLDGHHRHALPSEEDPVDAILEQLDPHSLDEDLFRALLGHYERAGRLADAENMLFFWLEASQPSAQTEIQREGRAFYERLEALSDEELAADGFSRREIDEGIRALDEMVSTDG